jgi:cellulose synthase operon protein C
MCVAVLLFGSVACNTDPKQEALKHVARGDQYVAKGKVAEAVVEYRTAIANDPTHGEAHYKLAHLYMTRGEVREAYGEYARAADLLPERDDVQLNAGRLSLVGRQYEDAKQRARTVLRRNPNNAEALILMGNALAGLKDLEGAVDLTVRAAELDPSRRAAYRNVGVFELARGDAEAAERAFRRAVELAPKSISARLSLAQFLRGADRFAEAEPVLKQALVVDANSVVANQAMAAFYIEARRIPEAEPYLKAAARLANTVDATLGLADYYIGTARLNDAERVLEELAKNKDAFSFANGRLAVVEFLRGDKAKSYQRLDAALAKDPKNASAMAMKARLLLTDHKVDEALAVAKAASDADPRSADAQLMQGRVQVVRGELEPARQTFKQVLEIDPRNVEAQMQLARLHLQRLEIPTAIDFAKQGAQSNPDNLEARLLYIRTLEVRNEDFDKAETELKQLAQRFPKAPGVYNAFGDLAIARNDGAAARRAFDAALKLDPNNVDALSGIASLAAAAGKLPDARALVDAKLAATPSHPGLLFLSAKIAVVAKDWTAAEKLLRRTIDVDPSNMQAYTMLGQVFVTQHRTAEAKTEFVTIAERQPTSIPARTMLGLLCQADHDVDCAIKWYEKAVQIDEKHAGPAANNLAWIYLTRNTNLDAAVRLAESAKAQLPNQAEVQDTLGWAYFKKGQLEAAMPALTRAVELDPSNPIHHYHVGMALAQKGDDARARKSLELALKMKPDFDGASQARAALNSLVF